MQQPHKIAIAGAFSRAARHYDDHACFQRLSGEHLRRRLGRQQFRRVLDAGCGTGNFSHYWRGQGAQVWALDFSASMLAVARQKHTADYYLLGDIEQLPLNSGQFDLCWSNLALQWCDNLAQGLRELYRVTAQGGWLAFTTLAQGTFSELHQAWRAVDDHLHGNVYPQLPQILAASPAAGMHWDQQSITQYYPTVLSAMHSVKGTGATHLYAGRLNSTLTRQQLQQLALAWPRSAQGFGLTYQLVSGVIQHE